MLLSYLGRYVKSVVGSGVGARQTGNEPGYAGVYSGSGTGKIPGFRCNFVACE